MAVRDDIVGYLRQINPTIIERAPEVETLKLRRVLDSLDMMEFLTHLESSYTMKISDQDVLSRNFETVGSVIDFISERKPAD